MEKITAYAATGNLGYGFPEISLENGLKANPAFLASDAGSCDPGPNYMGMGKAFVSRAASKRDLRLLTKAALEKNIPLIIGSSGGSGSDQGVTWQLDILKEILLEEGLHAKVGVIRSELTHAYLHKKLKDGKFCALGHAPEMTAQVIDESVHIVACLGPEPIQEALSQGAQIVIAGRTTDASVYAAIPLMRGYDPGLVWHASKIIECGAAMAVPKSSDSMLAHIYDDHFVVEPPNPAKKVKMVNVAAHTMYECPHPTQVHEPSGIIDASECAYQQIDDRRVSVSGSRLLYAPYSVKLEAVKLLGFRAITVGGTHDPTLISIIDEHIAHIKGFVDERVKNLFPDMQPGGYQIHFHIYGRNGVMGEMEKNPAKDVHELGIVIDVLSTTQERANTILAAARTLLMHSDYPNRKCIAGSIAFLFSPSDIPVGEVYCFNMDHSILLEDPLEPARIEILDL